MVLKVYTVYDSKVESYLPPFCMKNDGEALRAWEEVVNDPKSQFYKHPSDYTLFALGSFCDHQGVFTSDLVKRPLGTALEYKKSQITPSHIHAVENLTPENTYDI